MYTSAPLKKLTILVARFYQCQAIWLRKNPLQWRDRMRIALISPEHVAM